MKNHSLKPPHVLTPPISPGPIQILAAGARVRKFFGFILAAAFCLLAVPYVKAAATPDIWLGAGSDTLWIDAANWSVGVPTAANCGMLTNAAATGLPGTNGMGAVGTPNITVTTSTSIGQLWIVNSNYNNSILSYHTIGISPGVSLTVSNSGANLNSPNILQVMSSGGLYSLFGGNGVSGNQDGNYTIYSTIQGGSGSTLNVICTNSLNASWTTGSGNITVEEGALGAGSSSPLNATLDLSGLDYFNASVNHLCVGADGGSGAYYFERPRGTLWLAKTNCITLWAVGTFPSEGATQGILAGIMAINNGAGTNYGGSIFLGLTNGIFCDTGIGLGLRGISGFIGFNTNNPAGISSVYFRNKAGTGRQSLWSLGDRTGTAANNNQDVQGIMDYSLGTIDAMVSTLRMGVSTVTGNRSMGFLGFGAGVIDVNSIVLGCQTVSGMGAAQGLITVSNTAVLKVNTSAQIGTIAGTTVGSFPYFGQIIITNGGSVQFGNTTTITCGTGNSEIDVVNGSSLTVGMVGSSSAPLTTLAVLTNNMLTIDLGAKLNPSVALVQVSTLNSAGTNIVNVLGTGLMEGRITLIKYGTWNNDGSTAAVINFAPGTNSPGVQGYITNNPANNSIDFVVTVGTVTALVWNGMVGVTPNGAWDINLTPDWQGAQKYTQPSILGSLVQFDDTAAGTTTVTISDSLAPVLMIVTNNALTYTFTGTDTNALTGPGKLIKDGSGLMTLNNTGTNTGTGEIDINNGTLQIGGSDNRLPVGASVVLGNTSTATLDLNSFNQTLGSISGGGTTGGNITEGSGNLSITGSGNYGGVISGSGMLFKQTGGTLTLTGANLYSGGTVVSNGQILVANPTGSGLGSGSVFIAGGSVQLGDGLTANGSIAAPYITNNGTLYLVPASDYTLTNLIVGSGGLNKTIGAGSTTIYITNDNTYTGVSTIGWGRLQISSSHALGSGTIACGNQTIDNTWLALSGGITVNNAVTLSGKTGGIIPAVDQINNIDGTNTLTGSILLGGATVFAVGADAGELILTGNLINNQVAVGGATFFLRGAGNGVWQGAFNQGAGNPLLLSKYDSGTWTLSAANTYTGPTIINGGKLVVNGSIVGSSRVYVAPGATLAGNGTITAAVTNEGTIFPGVDPALGTLTISNVLFLDSGTAVTFDVSTNGNDEIRGMSTVTYGGTLNVNVLGVITGNCIFKLFDAAVYTGTFDGGFNLPDISPLTWDTSHLSVDGTLHVTGGPVVSPAVTNSGFTGGGFNLSGTGTLVAPYSILASTNLATPIVDWLNIGGGTFSNGTFNITDPTATNFPTRFYLLSTPMP